MLFRSSFQAGVDVLHGKCTELGFTPAGKTPSNISDTISKIYTDRYNSGYTNGRTQGQNDVIANPTGYGINAGGIINNQFGRIGWKRLRSSFGAGSHTILWTYKVHGKYIPEFEVRNITTNSQIWHFKPNEGEGDEPAIVSDWSFNLSSPAVLDRKSVV